MTEKREGKNRNKPGPPLRGEAHEKQFGLVMKPAFKQELREFADIHGVDMSDILRDGAAFLMSGKLPESMSLVKCTQQACGDLLGRDALVVHIPEAIQAQLHAKAQSLSMDAAQLVRQLATVTADKEPAAIVEYTVGDGWRHAAAIEPNPQAETKPGSSGSTQSGNGGTLKFKAG